MAAEDESQQELTLVSLPLDSIPMTVFNSSPVAASGAAADRGDGVQPTAIEAAATTSPTTRSEMTTTTMMYHEIDVTAAAGAAATSPQEEREAVFVPERRSRRFLRRVSAALPFLLSALVLYIYYIYVVHVCSKRRLSLLFLVIVLSIVLSLYYSPNLSLSVPLFLFYPRVLFPPFSSLSDFNPHQTLSRMFIVCV